MKKIYVTTSWDDGSKLDLKLAGFLRKYDLPATFYIAKDYRKDRLSEEEIKDLAKGFEIGAHTLTHPNLDLISEETARFEMGESKRWLEELTMKDVSMFAYPRGRFNIMVKHLVEDLDFVGARTVEEFKYSLRFDPLEMPTSLRVAPYPWRKKEGGKLKFSGGAFGFQPRRYIRSLGLALKPASYFGFPNLAKGFFDKVLSLGGIFHLWGHSWEIEELNMWQALDSVLKYIAKRRDVEYLTNGEIITTLNR